MASLVPASASGAMSASWRSELQRRRVEPGPRNDAVHHPVRERRRRVDAVAEVEQLAGALETDDERLTRAGPTLEKRISGSPNTASSAAIVRSHIIANSQPPPRQWPWTEAIWRQLERDVVAE